MCNNIIMDAEAVLGSDVTQRFLAATLCETVVERYLICYSVLPIDCIKEMDVTSVTSPIGLWTAAPKPIVTNLGSTVLKISGACWEK